MSNQPKITVDLGCQSAVEYARLSGHVLHGRGSIANLMRQFRVDYHRDFALELVPYSVPAAREELDAAAEACADAMSRSPSLAEKVRALLEKADATDDIGVIASVIQDVKCLGSSPFIGGRS